MAWHSNFSKWSCQIHSMKLLRDKCLWCIMHIETTKRDTLYLLDFYHSYGIFSPLQKNQLSHINRFDI